MPLHVPENLADDIERWRKVCPDSSPDAFTFPNGNGGFQDTDNYRKRVLHALAERLGSKKLTFQVIRRTIATLALPEGTIKDVQGLLRHLQMPTTGNVYTQIISEGVVSTINAVSRKLRKEPFLKRSKTARFPSKARATNARRNASHIVVLEKIDTKSCQYPAAVGALN